MAPPLRPGPVANESPASQPLHNLQSELLAAQAAWQQLGVRIAKGYTMAYGNQTSTLDYMKKAKEAAMSNDGLIFVLSILSVGFSGGLAGGLIAPWIKEAEKQAALRVFRTAVSGVAQQAAKDLMKAGVSKVVGGGSDAGDPYTPATAKDLLVDEEIRDRIASAFGPILEALDAMIATANETQADAATGQAILNSFRQNCPLMTEKPAQGDIPSEKDVARAAELAMWKAWANERDWPWWDKQYKLLDDYKQYGTKNDYLGYSGARRAAEEMEPVGDRLLALGKWGDTFTSQNHKIGKAYDSSGHELSKEKIEEIENMERFTYTDLRKLRVLRIEPDVTLPFNKLPLLNMQWDKTKPLQRVKFLSTVQDVQPVYVKKT